MRWVQRALQERLGVHEHLTVSPIVKHQQLGESGERLVRTHELRFQQCTDQIAVRLKGLASRRGRAPYLAVHESSADVAGARQFRFPRTCGLALELCRDKYASRGLTVNCVRNSFLEPPLLAPEFGFHTRLSLKELFRLLTVVPVVSVTMLCIKRANMNSHVFVRDAIAVERKDLIVRVAASH